MSKSKIFNILLYFLFVAACLFLYLIFYIFPSLKTVNDIRVSGRDNELRLSDLKKTESAFIFPDKRELMILEAKENEIKNWIKGAANEKDPQIFTETMILELKKKFPEIKTIVKEKIDSSDVKNSDNEEVFNPEKFISTVNPAGSYFIRISAVAGISVVVNIMNYVDRLGFPLFIRNVRIKKSGKFYTARINYQLLYTEGKGEEKSFKESPLIDMNSELLLKRVRADAGEQ